MFAILNEFLNLIGYSAISTCVRTSLAQVRALSSWHSRLRCGPRQGRPHRLHQKLRQLVCNINICKKQEWEGGKLENQHCETTKRPINLECHFAVLQDAPGLRWYPRITLRHATCSWGLTPLGWSWPKPQVMKQVLKTGHDEFFRVFLELRKQWLDWLDLYTHTIVY